MSQGHMEIISHHVLLVDCYPKIRLIGWGRRDRKKNFKFSIPPHYQVVVNLWTCFALLNTDDGTHPASSSPRYVHQIFNRSAAQILGQRMLRLHKFEKEDFGALLNDKDKSLFVKVLCSYNVLHCRARKIAWHPTALQWPRWWLQVT